MHDLVAGERPAGDGLYRDVDAAGERPECGTKLKSASTPLAASARARHFRAWRCARALYE